MSYQADPSKIFGRDKQIDSIWKLLNQGKSIRFTAERRIGKTSIMQKMRAEPKTGYIPVLIDLERVHSPLRFVEVLAQECHAHQSVTNKISKFLKKYVGESVEVQGVKLSLTSSQDWRTTLEDLFANLCEKADEQIVLLLLDEIPYMLQNIDATSGEQDALEILDILRAIRHQYPNIRMIFTGSVGVHHVLKVLKSKGSSSQPLNDLTLLSIDPLLPVDALMCLNYFCTTLGIEPTETQRKRIAELCNGVPFYMDKVINKLDLLDNRDEISDQDIELVFDQLLSSDNDEWQMEHFVDRLRVYYLGECRDTNDQLQSRAKLAALILNEFAQTRGWLTVEEIYTKIASQISLSDKEFLRDLLADLVQDHYLKSQLDTQRQKNYQFAYTLVQKWWCIRHGLTLPREIV